MTVSDNAIYALIGRAMELKKYNAEYETSALCVTSKALSVQAGNVARRFRVSAKTNFPFKNFPFVKCKVLTESKVYYTPDDEGYITARIIADNGYIFCRTIAEAIAKGFSRP